MPPAAKHDQLRGLLIGTDVAPLVTPRASLATLIWFEGRRIAGVRTFVLTGAATATLALGAAVAALIGTR